MYQVAIQPLQSGTELAVSPDGTLGREQRDGLKVWREDADFFHLGRRSDQSVLILLVEPAQRAHHIADVGADAKIPHPPDVDGDLHRWHLITVGVLRLGSGAQRNYARTSVCAFARRSA